MTVRSESKPGDAEIVQMPLAEKPAAPEKPKRNPRRLVLLASVPVLLAAVGGYFWLTGGRYQDTDNAYVQQAKVALSADVAGRIASVSVHDNQAVKAGDVLFAIDPAPYQIALAQADAALSTARVNVEQLKVAYGSAQAQLDAAQGTLAIRQAAFDRKNALVQSGSASDATLDDVKLALETAQNAVTGAKQQLASASAALTGNPDIITDDHPAVRAALATRDAAARNLDKTIVTAPADGIVSQVASLNVGQFIATGTTIASLIETGETWVEANFKETQLASIHEGMPVEVKIDAYPGVVFEGRLDSISAATGAEFALIPAQNATGNWVKVTQRIPAHVSITPIDGKLLRAGMSAVVAVDTKPAG
ncbi:MAG: HlyD family secretion protein [Hyphomicrobiales bacterium]|nr:MAG: HlyD family secretion protein [Hyphomicrobiales bacterium]